MCYDQYHRPSKSVIVWCQLHNNSTENYHFTASSPAGCPVISSLFSAIAFFPLFFCRCFWSYHTFICLYVGDKIVQMTRMTTSIQSARRASCNTDAPEVEGRAGDAGLSGGDAGLPRPFRATISPPVWAGVGALPVVDTPSLLSAQPS